MKKELLNRCPRIGQAYRFLKVFKRVFNANDPMPAKIEASILIRKNYLSSQIKYLFE